MNISIGWIKRLMILWLSTSFIWTYGQIVVSESTKKVLISTPVDESNPTFNLNNELLFNQRVFEGTKEFYRSFKYKKDTLIDLKIPGQLIVSPIGLRYDKKTNRLYSPNPSLRWPVFTNFSEKVEGHLVNASTLLVAIESTYTYGEKDIYVYMRYNNAWKGPINLGSAVNTGLDEVSPFLAPDGKTLFFASNGYQGKGSFDIYYAVRMDNSWRNWSEPVPLDPLNTDGRERDFILNFITNKAYYTSTKDSNGYGEIYTVDFEWPELVINTNIEEDTSFNVLPETQVPNRNTLMLEVALINHKSGSPLDSGVVKINLLNNERNQIDSITHDNRGVYGINLPSAAFYNFEVSSIGFLSINKTIPFSDTLDLRTLTFRLSPLEKNSIIKLNNILFKQGTDQILPSSSDDLQALVHTLKTNPDVKIELRGHTDSRGSAPLNLELSQERVDKIKSILVSEGIPSNSIIGKGYGETEPIASNAKEETRRLNRRVEIKILE